MRFCGIHLKTFDMTTGVQLNSPSERIKGRITRKSF